MGLTRPHRILWTRHRIVTGSLPGRDRMPEVAQNPGETANPIGFRLPTGKEHKRGPKPGPVVPKMETEAKRQNRGA
jgi:hypothetical protein